MRPYHRITAPRKSSQPPRRRPGIEALERRALLATVLVTDAGDAVGLDGVVTLREAISSISNGAAVNADVVPTGGGFGTNDRIEFSIPGAGVHRIQPQTVLPAITRPVVIDGYTQDADTVDPADDATPNTNPADQGTNAVLRIELNGSGIPSGVADGLRITGGGVTIRGLIINGFPQHGILITGSGNNVVIGNFIGTNAAGTAAETNRGAGVKIVDSPGNRIGGTLPADRNVISGNRGTVDTGFGEITIQGNPAADNLVQGNFLGVDAAGTMALDPDPSISSGSGVSVTNAPGTVIGGTAAGAGNVISGNEASGISLSNAGGTIVRGNLIGTDVTGTLDLGNGLSGISVTGNSTATIGGTTEGAGNVVSGNDLSGVFLQGIDAGSLVAGNFIGTDRTRLRIIPNGTAGNPNTGTGVLISSSGNTVGGVVAGAGNTIAFNTGVGVGVTSATGNRILGNSIFANAGLGTDLSMDGVTANDPSDTQTGVPGDTDTGSNNHQNFPQVLDATRTASSTSVQGFLDTQPGTYRVEVFANDAADPSGHGEGQTFLGFTDVVVPATGVEAWFLNDAPLVAPGQFITATATDAQGNTSEFGSGFLVPASGADLRVELSTPDPTSPLTTHFVVTNGGPDAAAGVHLSIDMTPGTTFSSFDAPAGFAVTAPPVGGTGTITADSSDPLAEFGSLQFTLVFEAAVGQLVDTKATVSSSTADPETANNVAMDQTFVAGIPTIADLGYTINGPATVAAGDTITYNIGVYNSGPGAGTNARLDVPIPAGTTFVSLASPPGWVQTVPPVGGTGTASATLASLPSGNDPNEFTMVVRINPGTPSGTTITAAPAVSSDLTDNDPDNEEETVSTTVAQPPPGPDLAVFITDTPDTVPVGTSITYQLVVRNNGPDARNVTLSTAVPAGTTFAALVPPAGWATTAPAFGETGTITASIASLPAGTPSTTILLVVRVSADAIAGATINLAAQVAADPSVPDQTPADNSDTEVTTVGASSGQPDLAIVVDDAPDPVAANTDVSYRILATRVSSNTEEGVILAASVPANTTFVSFTAPDGWAVTTPAVGGTGTVTATALGLGQGTGETFTLVVHVSPAVAAGSTLSTTAQIISILGDSNGTNDADTESTLVVAPTPTNTAPVARPDIAQATGDQSRIIPVLANDSDAENDPLTVVIVAQPTNGTLTVHDDGSVTYAPNMGFVGTDAFTYRVSDGRLLSEPATVSITVVPTDTTGPRVLGLKRLGFHSQPTLLVLTFDEALNAASASRVGNYRLRAAGRDGRFGTADDVVIPLLRARYADANGATVTIRTRRPLPLRHAYRLTIRDGVTDHAGNTIALGGRTLGFNRSALVGPSLTREQLRARHIAHALRVKGTKD